MLRYVIGREVVHGGVEAILARYRRAYPTREAMGKLTFSEIEVRPLADGVALATGKFTLKRSTAGGGDASGRFTLILQAHIGQLENHSRPHELNSSWDQSLNPEPWKNPSFSKPAEITEC